jgi:hypothetical protein
MPLREVTKRFYATRLPREADDSCASLEGLDTSGDVPFEAGQGPLNDGFEPRMSVVNGKQVVRFVFGSYAYCAELAVYEDSTRKISGEGSL